MDASQLLSSISSPQEASHYDELSMKQSFNFSDSLKDMKDLRKQLYSAADYFELSYNRQDQKQMVVNTLRDYTTKAFIKTVDHLGSMTYKVKCLLDDKIEEASAIELKFSCVRQRLQTCEMFTDHGGLSQQSLAIRTPKHHMQYTLPGTPLFTRFVIGLLRPKVWSWLMLKNFLSVSKAKDGGDSKNLQYCMKSGVNGEMSAGEHHMHPRNIETSVSFVRTPHSATRFPQSSPISPFSFASTSSDKKAEKCASPFRFQLARSGSLVDRSTAPNPSNAKKRYPSEPRGSTSMSTQRNRRTDIELYPSKNIRLFKALLSMRKWRKDSKLYKFLDEN
ncbi:hypothetical protein BT93_E0790 [Corymbia citriodora subsp. variegata]|nr:hypothetical protein BT93_E0790 [Corymbia citriodora subsp. variegata]